MSAGLLAGARGLRSSLSASRLGRLGPAAPPPTKGGLAGLECPEDTPQRAAKIKHLAQKSIRREMNVSDQWERFSTLGLFET